MHASRGCRAPAPRDATTPRRSDVRAATMPAMTGWEIFWIALGAVVLAVLVHDLVQGKYPVLRIFPVIGHVRYLLMEVGPELRQYIVAQNREELPFNRS